MVTTNPIRTSYHDLRNTIVKDLEEIYFGNKEIPEKAKLLANVLNGINSNQAFIPGNKLNDYKNFVYEVRQRFERKSFSDDMLSNAAEKIVEILNLLGSKIKPQSNSATTNTAGTQTVTNKGFENELKAQIDEIQKQIKGKIGIADSNLVRKKLQVLLMSINNYDIDLSIKKLIGRDLIRARKYDEFKKEISMYANDSKTRLDLVSIDKNLTELKGILGYEKVNSPEEQNSRQTIDKIISDLELKLRGKVELNDETKREIKDKLRELKNLFTGKKQTIKLVPERYEEIVERCGYMVTGDVVISVKTVSFLVELVKRSLR